MSDESHLWKSSSSQWLNAWHFLWAAAGVIGLVFAAFWFIPLYAVAPIPVLWAVWRYLVVRTRIYELTSERLRITSGVFNQTVDEVELYRVKDTLMLRPWWMRLIGLSTIVLETSDRSLPKVEIPALPKGSEFRERLRKQVELQRDKKRVRELDFDDANDVDNLL
jgi:membrane protein YdbS with pleckstrin-like domain